MKRNENKYTLLILVSILVLVNFVLACPADIDDKEEIKGCLQGYAPSSKDELIKNIKSELGRQGNEADLNCIDTSAITNMSGLFKVTDEDSSKVKFNGKIDEWDVRKVTTMADMFNGALVFNQDISGWVVNKVTNMNGMFSGATAFNQDIGGWTVDNVTSTNNMFSNAEAFVQNLDYWGVKKITSMSKMFDNSGLADNPPWWYGYGGKYPCIETYSPNDKTTLEANIATEIKEQGNEADLNCIDTSAITNMSELFKNKTRFNGKIDKWDVSKVKNMNGIFNKAEAFNQDISGWVVSNVTNMYGMFREAKAFNQNIGKWDVSKVTTMATMFQSAASFNKDIGKWDVRKVRKMNLAFESAYKFNQDLSGWEVSDGTNVFSMFYRSGVKKIPQWYHRLV